MIKQLGFFPTESQLLQKSMQEMSRMFIKKIDFDNAGRLYRLTFVFSDNIRSPPENSYRDEPEESYAVPYGTVLTAL